MTKNSPERTAFINLVVARIVKEHAETLAKLAKN